MSLHKVGYLIYFHSETDIRLVRTIEIHGIIPAHARNPVCNLNIQDILEKSPHHALECSKHVLLLHKRHLTVYLGELRLTVSTQILVTETAHNLEIAVIAGHHEKLLESLGRLRKGVELARIHA